MKGSEAALEAAPADPPIALEPGLVRELGTYQLTRYAHRTVERFPLLFASAVPLLLGPVLGLGGAWPLVSLLVWWVDRRRGRRRDLGSRSQRWLAWGAAGGLESHRLIFGIYSVYWLPLFWSSW